MEVEGRFNQDMRVASNMMDSKCRLTTWGMLEITQELASNHYSFRRSSMPHMIQKGYTWVLVKQRFEIREYPLWLDFIEASTWVKGIKGLFTYRDFAFSFNPGGKFATLDRALEAQHQAFENAGKVFTPRPLVQDEDAVFFRGTSSWMILDLQTGRPVKPVPEIGGDTPMHTVDALPPDFSKINLYDSWDMEVSIEPNLTDIDLNNHVNNLVYVRWILSWLPESVHQNKLISELETYYVSSAVLGQELLYRVKILEDSRCIHSIIRKKDGSEVFKAISRWKNEDEMCRPLVLE